MEIDTLQNMVASDNSSYEAFDLDLSRLANSSLTPEQEVMICQKISSIDHDLLRTDGILAMAQAIIAQYTVRRAHQAKSRAAYATLVSPLRLIPFEVLSHIFVYAYADSRYSRWDVSHVCQRWRQAALATSELWTAIEVELPRLEPDVQEYVKECVGRANSRPMTWICREEEVMVELHGTLMETAKSTRWKEFSWISPMRWHETTAFEHLVPYLVNTSADTLETLGLSNFSNYSDATIDNPDDETEFNRRKLNMTSLSRLSKLTISLSYPIDAGILNAPWSRLTQLSINTTRAGQETTLNMLRQCSNLESCMLSIHYFDPVLPDGTWLGNAINLTKLRKLHLFSATAEMFAGITDVLLTPVLHDLIIESDTIYFEFEDSNVKDYLLLCAETLRRLWISGIGFSDVDNFILPNFPLLEELTLIGLDDMDEEALLQLTVEDPFPADEEMPLPHLRALSVICQAHPAIQAAFINLVKSRWWLDTSKETNEQGLARLRYASLHQKERENRLTVLDEVEILRDQGLNLNVLMPKEHDFMARFLTEDEISR